jgi:hypothetical protein
MNPCSTTTAITGTASATKSTRQQSGRILAYQTDTLCHVKTEPEVSANIQPLLVLALIMAVAANKKVIPRAR